MQFQLITAGSFMMGCEDVSREENDWIKEQSVPQHEVTISKPFYLGIYQVTQQEWEAVMGTRPWEGKKYGKSGSRYPATYISWNDCQEFIEKLNEKEGFKNKYRLPTEAEWEYACRAGTTTRYSFGDDENDLGKYAWYEKNANGLVPFKGLSI